MANSTAVLTDCTTLKNGTPTALSMAKALTQAADNLDPIGMANSIFQNVAETKVMLLKLEGALDAADPLLTLAQNIAGTLS
jgi:hypothetical protein